MEIIFGLIVFLVLVSLITGSLSGKFKKYRELIKQPLNDDHRQIVENNFKLYLSLTREQQLKLEGLINLFLEEKNFEGCGGLEITDEIRVTIAAQACLLLLNNSTQPWYSRLTTIYVYPSAYKTKVNGVMANGFVGTKEVVRLGESWVGGTVVLSWNHSKHGAINFEDGKNVVLHEFAHQLDQADGDSDGVPALATENCYMSWGVVHGKEFDKLVRKTMKNHKTVMDKYGATNEAEFFAVATESFFEKPAQMTKKHPELYDTLKKYYGLDPVSWDYRNHKHRK